MDRVSPEQRSLNMSAVHSANTKPEISIRKMLFKEGYRYRLYDKKLPGKPDIVLKKYNAVIFINGCFWHGHENCKKAKLPDANFEFWQSKINANKLRDQKQISQLIESNWRVLIVWTCALKKSKLDEVFALITKWIQGQAVYTEIFFNDAGFIDVKE